MEQKEMRNYHIIRERDFMKLTDMVNERIARGYEPCGGIAADQEYLYQAMILPKQEKK